MNSHIKDAVKQYITQEVNPEYAIMINGPWGCGKTYFVDDLQTESWLKNTDGKKEKKVVKISLYGVTSKEDIETQLFYAVNAFLDGKKKLKKLGDVAHTFLGGTFNVDGKTAMSLFFKEWSKKVRVIIVDDLERSSMPIHETMGYFYNYIIEQDIRIIFIGNEDEIKDAEGNLDEHYKRTKEKVIGETYTIQPQIEEAVRVFLSPERKVDIPIPTDRAVKTCLEVVNNLQIHNLRTIWQGLVKVQRLLKEVVDTDAYKSVNYEPSEYGKGDNTKADYLNGIFELYLVLYLQLASGDIDKDDKSLMTDTNEKSIVVDVIGIYKKGKCSLKALEKEEERENEKPNNGIGSVASNHSQSNNDYQKKQRRRYLGFVALQSSDDSGGKLWSDYLFHSKLDNEVLNMSVEADKQWFIPRKVEEDVKSNLYILVSRSLEMAQEEFEEYYNNMINEFKNGEYVNVGELINGYSLCLTYKEYRVREYKEGEISQLFDEVLDNTDVKVALNGDYGHVFTRGSMGYAYTTDMTVGEGKEFVNKMRAIVKEKQKVDIKKAFVEEFESISSKEEFMSWAKLLYSNTERDYHTYYSKPVLSWIEGEQLFTELISLSFDNQFNFIDALKERYGMRYSNGMFGKNHFPDFERLVLLKERYNSLINSLEVGQIESYRLTIILERLRELVSYCSQYVPEEGINIQVDSQAE